MFFNVQWSSVYIYLFCLVMFWETIRQGHEFCMFMHMCFLALHLGPVYILSLVLYRVWSVGSTSLFEYWYLFSIYLIVLGHLYKINLLYIYAFVSQFSIYFIGFAMSVVFLRLNPLGYCYFVLDLEFRKMSHLTLNLFSKIILHISSSY